MPLTTLKLSQRKQCLNCQFLLENGKLKLSHKEFMFHNAVIAEATCGIAGAEAGPTQGCTVLATKCIVW
ncbi:hypothetical protein J6590_078609 [Homalodisca vitripennis]|nr:hypothetical protein J6590_078609 [Homalodisca vitripennis]